MAELSSVAKGHQRVVDRHAQGPDFVVVLQHGPDLLRGAAGRGEVAGGGGSEGDDQPISNLPGEKACDQPVSDLRTRRPFGCDEVVEGKRETLHLSRVGVECGCVHVLLCACAAVWHSAV